MPSKGSCKTCGKEVRVCGNKVGGGTRMPTYCRMCWLLELRRRSDNGNCVGCGTKLSRWSVSRCKACQLRHYKEEPKEEANKHDSSEYFDTTDWLRRPLI